MKNLSLLFICIFFLFCSCKQADTPSGEIQVNNSINRDLKIISQRISEQPKGQELDSLLFYLFDSIYSSPENSDDLFGLANYYSTLGTDYLIRNEYAKAEKAIQESIDFCSQIIDQHENPDKWFLFVRGNSYSDKAILSYHLSFKDEAHEYLNLALSDYFRSKDTLFIAMLYSQISDLLREKDLHSEALKMNLESQKYNTAHFFDFDLEIKNKLGIANSYTALNEYTNAKVLLDSCLLSVTSVRQSVRFAIYYSYTKYFISTNQLDKAEESIKKINYEKGNTIDKQYRKNKLSKTLLYIELYLAQANYSKALSHIDDYEKLLNDIPKWEKSHLRPKILKYQIRAHDQIGNYEYVLILNQKLNFFLDSINTVRNLEILNIIERNRILTIRNSNSKVEILKNQAIRRTNSFIFTALIVTLALILLLVIILKQKNTNIRKSKTILEKNYEIKELELQREQKDRETLERLAVSNNILLSAKNKIYKQLETRILSMNSSIATRESDLKFIKQALDNNLKLDKDWENTIKHYKEINFDFYKSLKNKYPELTNEELKLCAYLRLNISSKDMARMLYVTEDAITKRRHRLRKKLNIDSKINLFKLFNEW